MVPIRTEELITFLKTNIQPRLDTIYGNGYRASVTLVDGLHLPCVVFRNPSSIVDLAIKRFKDERSGRSIFSKSSGFGYKEIVKNFVTNGNCINHYDIAKVDKSNFAFPLETLKQIEGETTMGWTGFVAKMKDQKQFAFGTPFLFDFFDLPNGYQPTDITQIINHSYFDKEGTLKNYHDPKGHEHLNDIVVYRERPYFECYVDNL